MDATTDCERPSGPFALAGGADLSRFSCENIVLWRGHFEATGAEKSVNLSINGGNAFAGSVWLNDVFIGTSFGK
jgi:hypothetical protein